MSRKVQTAIGALAVVGLLVGVVVLRELTESRHVPSPPGSQTVIEFSATTNLEHLGPTLADLVAAASTVCRLEIDAQPVGPVAAPMRDDRYRTVLSPALDRTERARYAGCLEDWRIDHLQLDVVAMHTSPPGQ